LIRVAQQQVANTPARRRGQVLQIHRTQVVVSWRYCARATLALKKVVEVYMVHIELQQVSALAPPQGELPILMNEIVEM
jgi:hypothetical protein